MSALCHSLKCSSLRVMRYAPELRELERKKLIRSTGEKYGKLSGETGACYHIPSEVISALEKDGKYTPPKRDNISIDKLFVSLEELFALRLEGDISFSAFMDELKELINGGSHIVFAKKVKNLRLNGNYLILLFYFFRLFSSTTRKKIQASSNWINS